MAVSLCIHGHFYQPPREDPWLGRILVEASAAPMRHWNERILRESYAPLAWARRLDGEGRIADVLNSYEWISFNAGPTLLQWMRRAAPEVLARMREGDANSLARWGHGNAMAQIYHHVIMPLASARDKMLEIRWAIDDFRFHFKREPEGMWLSECAVDPASLEALAACGIRFVILAPRQARALVLDGQQVPVDEGSLHVGEPYRVSLPSGGSMTVVFYHGGLSQGIAFEGLLRNGEHFWQRIVGQAGALASSGAGSSLLTLATDGETYGHHFAFGEMALAYVLAQGYARRDGLGLTNPAAFIAANPPTREVILHEPSSWSCVHGVERWRSDCGCTDGGHPGWNQRWRGPLRDALNLMRAGVDECFAREGKDCFHDPEAALAAYGEVLADPSTAEAFAAARFTGGAEQQDKAWKLLAMQEQALAAFASCAWFFDDIARIEPENAMTFALRALELMQDVGGPDIGPAVLGELEKAFSNQQEYGNGAVVFERDVLPRRDDAAALCLLAWLLLRSESRLPAPGASSLYVWPNVSVELFAEAGEGGIPCRGAAAVRVGRERFGSRYAWHLEQQAASLSPLDMVMVVKPEGSGDEACLRRCAREFSQPLRDFVLLSLLRDKEKARRGELAALASQVFSFISPWLEAQHNLPMPEYWVGFLPYMAVEGMCDDTITDRQREQVRSIFAMHLPERGKRLAGELVRERLLSGLGRADAPAQTDETLALWLRRVRLMLDDIDLWSVQNALWEQGCKNYPALAKELGFR